MKMFLRFLTKIILPLTCIIVAMYMAINRIEGWGWFLFIAVLVGQ